MLWKRVISACVFVPLLLVLMWLGGWFWYGGVLVIIALGLKEYCSLLEIKGIKLPLGIMLMSAVLTLSLQYFADGALGSLALLISVFALIVWVLMKEVEFGSLAYGVAGMVLIAWPLSALLGIWHIDQSWKLVLMTFIIPWLTDTGAYFVGSAIGKHKMAPDISPNKSWEGAVGGLIIGVLAVLLYNALILHYPMWLILVIGVVCSFAGQLGDLMESWLKRWVGVKDSGNTIPGHGGILDRFDSMLLVAPVAYYILLIYTKYMFW
ncbi:MAG: phosphatidate cytidylyltransferase [Bacillota bacterium]|jgi:phosphatidate cytidylyltransferase